MSVIGTWELAKVLNINTSVNTPILFNLPTGYTVTYNGERASYEDPFGIAVLENYETSFSYDTTTYNFILNGTVFGIFEGNPNDVSKYLINPHYLVGTFKVVVTRDGETFEQEIVGNGWIDAEGNGIEPDIFEFPTEVTDETSANWFLENKYVETKPLVEITYNGSTIAELNSGETATLKCKDLPMASDVVVKVNKVEEPVDDSIVGTWVGNDTLVLNNYLGDRSFYFNILFTSYNTEFINGYVYYDSVNEEFFLIYRNTNGRDVTAYDSGWQYADENGGRYRTINITDDTFADEHIKTWVKANFRKQ